MPLPRKKFHIVVDDAMIAAGMAAEHPGDVIEPVWFLSDIYHGPLVYEHTLQQFSRPQRLVRATMLYLSEVNNGGHKQFFYNSSGIVWRDARDCFEEIGVPRGAQRFCRSQPSEWAESPLRNTTSASNSSVRTSLTLETWTVVALYSNLVMPVQ
jgi:hypothetical protein